MRELIVNPNPVDDPNRLSEEVGLFNPDGTPFSGGGSKELLIASHYHDSVFGNYLGSNRKIESAGGRYTADIQDSANGIALITAPEATAWVRDDVDMWTDNAFNITGGPNWIPPTNGILTLQCSFWGAWESTATTKIFNIAADISTMQYYNLNSYIPAVEEFPFTYVTYNKEFFINKDAMDPADDRWGIGFWIRSKVNTELFAISEALFYVFWTPMDTPDLSALSPTL